MQQNSTFLTITGNIRYNMTNDYMFRAILQSNPNILRGLLGSLLHTPPEEIEDITIENPILLGESFKDKKYILDILVKLNKSAFVNLEMQLINKHNWNDRSLLYLCRVFGNLETGDDYINVLPATHIGFLNYTVSPDNPQFYYTYKLLDTKNNHVYSDKFTLCVVDLTQIDLATDDDKAYLIDRWAKIFKADTWEELRMLTKDNEYMQEVPKTLYNCNMDPKICKQCQDWEFEQKLAKLDENYKKHLKTEIINQVAEIENQAAKIENQAAKIENQAAKIESQAAEIESQAAEIESLKAQLATLTQSQQ